MHLSVDAALTLYLNSQACDAYSGYGSTGLNSKHLKLYTLIQFQGTPFTAEKNMKKYSSKMY